MFCTLGASARTKAVDLVSRTSGTLELTSIPRRKRSAARGAQSDCCARGLWRLEFACAKASEAAPAVNSHSLRDPNCGWRRARVIGNLGDETAAAGSLP